MLENNISIYNICELNINRNISTTNDVYKIFDIQSTAFSYDFRPKGLLSTSRPLVEKTMRCFACNLHINIKRTELLQPDSLLSS